MSNNVDQGRYELTIRIIAEVDVETVGVLGASRGAALTRGSVFGRRGGGERGGKRSAWGRNGCESDDGAEEAESRRGCGEIAAGGATTARALIDVVWISEHEDVAEFDVQGAVPLLLVQSAAGAAWREVGRGWDVIVFVPEQRNEDRCEWWFDGVVRRRAWTRYWRRRRSEATAARAARGMPKFGIIIAGPGGKNCGGESASN
ncbi:hypothetical protein C8J57DRAFT_1225207 [Mycena rebaudengoi]|nr:hypothetical protein C8J57DRAFT_1225207 [Mycena rebaudengoi]